MLVQSLTTRSVHFAHLFGPPRTIGRQEASAVYDKVCESLRLDDFTFRYESARDSATPKSQGFTIQLERKEGRGVFGLTVDNPSIQHPVRLLVRYEWPPSLEDVYQRCDLVSEAVFDALPGPWHKVYAEVRLRAHCAERGKNALAFLRERLLKAPSDWLDSLGAPLSFVSCKFATSGAAAISGPLDAPLREFSMEVLREDRTALYFELVSKWTQVPGAGALPVDASSLRPFTARPSEYVKSEHEFLRERLAQLSKGLG